MSLNINSKPNCIIAARSGSKRLKNKNILKIVNKTLIEIVIKKVIESNIFDKVFVSTDSNKIAKIAKKSGALVPFLRSKKLSSDKVGILPVLKDFLLKTECKLKDYNFFVYPTAILLSPNDLKKSSKKFLKVRPNFLVSLNKFTSNPLKSIYIDNKKKVKFHFPQYIKKRSQDMKEYYHDAGYFFIFNTSYFLKNGFDEKNNSYYILKQNNSVDINTIEDFKLAKILYLNTYKNK